MKDRKATLIYQMTDSDYKAYQKDMQNEKYDAEKFFANNDFKIPSLSNDDKKILKYLAKRCTDGDDFYAKLIAERPNLFKRIIEYIKIIFTKGYTAMQEKRVEFDAQKVWKKYISAERRQPIHDQLVYLFINS